MANNAIREKNLQDLANAIKTYTDGKLATVGGGASYTLPTASTTQKGGVVIGTGLSMAGDTLNVTLSGETYDDFTGASASAAGLSGLVPAPQAGDNEKFLRGDGQWVTLSGGETYSEATTLTSGLMSATDKAKLNNIANNANNYTLPTASTSTKGGVIIGNGLEMNGDTLSVTLSGGSTGGSDTELVLSNVASTVNGAIWLDSLVAVTAGEAITLSTLMPATVVNGSMWLEV